MVKERGIVFSPEMVKAIFDGRKVMTRRVVKRPPDPSPMPGGKYGPSRPWVDTEGVWHFHRGTVTYPIDDIGKCPYGAAGDRLWVREKFAGVCGVSQEPKTMAEATYVCFPDGSQKFRKGGYYHDGKGGEKKWPSWLKWKSPRFISRWASRLTLTVTGVTVERVQDISDEDIKREGINLTRDSGELVETAWYQDRFRCLWDTINGVHAPWAMNPWVWVVSFEMVKDEAKGTDA